VPLVGQDIDTLTVAAGRAGTRTVAVGAALVVRDAAAVARFLPAWATLWWRRRWRTVTQRIAVLEMLLLGLLGHGDRLPLMTQGGLFLLGRGGQRAETNEPTYGRAEGTAS
jgi:hypothetical protein